MNLLYKGEKIMKKISIFESINKEDINKMLKCFEAKTRTFKKDSTILTYLGNTSMIGIIIKGKAELIRNDYNGNRTILETLTENDIFGEIFSNYNTDELSVKATEETEVLFIDYYHITKRCKKACPYHSTLVENTLNILSQKIVTNNERIEILAKRTIREKLLAYFDIMSKKKLSKTFTIPLTYTDLADYLGIDRSAMQRELKNLKEDELISTTNKKITLNY